MFNDIWADCECPLSPLWLETHEKSIKQDNLFCNKGAESRWRRNRTGDHFLFYKFIERTIER